MYRDGAELDLAYEDELGELVRVNHGRLTTAGEAALVEAAEMFGPELASDLSTCREVDGVDWRVTLEREGVAYRLEYCAGSKEFGIDALTAILRSIGEALSNCQGHEYVTIGDCSPV